jgi:chromosome partitioning protein
MIKITFSNQRGGVGKTTSTLTVARCLADRGMKVLVIDTDSQGSIWMTLELEPPGWLHQFVNDGLSLSEVVAHAAPNLDVICSDRRTMRVEATLAAQTAKEMIFYSLLSSAEQEYDAILFDVAPSISHLQSCAIAYTRNVLIPVGMDSLSVEGARASLQSIEVLNHFLKLGCRCIGFLPTMVDNRLSATELVLRALKSHSDVSGIPIIHPIRTDQEVNKAFRNQKFIQDWNPKSKALEDYEAACSELLTALGKSDVQHEATTATH